MKNAYGDYEARDLGKEKEEEKNDVQKQAKEKGKDTKGTAGRTIFDFNFDYQRPFYIKYVKVGNWETQQEVQQEERYKKLIQQEQWEEFGMETEEWLQDTGCKKNA